MEMTYSEEAGINQLREKLAAMTKREIVAMQEEIERQGIVTKSDMPKSDIANRQTQIARECVHLTNEINELHEKISILDDRLSAILRYSDPKPEDVEKAESLVPFAEFVRGKAWLVSSAIERIDSILQRLEL